MDWVDYWGLIPDGEPIVTASSRLLPVRQNGVAAMLKIAVEPEESYGAWLMDWWGGDGAARVLAHEGDALLLERAEGTGSLVAMAHAGADKDDEACRVLCRVVARLHAPRNRFDLPVIPLTQWFRELWPVATAQGGILAQCAHTARLLLDSPQETTILHGDIHHANVLDFGSRGWLAIDPKRLGGERGFDYANLFSNPDPEIALAPGRFARRVAIVVAAAGLDRQRLLQWIVAQSGLSAAWTLGVGGNPSIALTVAHLAATELQL